MSLSVKRLPPSTATTNRPELPHINPGDPVQPAQRGLGEPELANSLERRKPMKRAIVIVLGKVISLMLMGLAYAIMRRTSRSWFL